MAQPFRSPASNMLEHIFYIRPGRADEVEGLDGERGVSLCDPLFSALLPDQVPSSTQCPGTKYLIF